MFMDLNYAIFRTEPINTLNELAQIGLHNKREKKAYNSNPDIDITKCKNNIEIVPLTDKYVKGFYNLTKEYKKQHDERIKNEREDRKRSYSRMVNESRNVVADELLFTASNKFFQNMTADDIKEWANTCMEFVYKDLGYSKDQFLHATIYMDEKTPHIHLVVVSLIKKFDKRTNCERFTISKKQYIEDKIHLSQLQDKYHARLVSKGYDLERGIKGSDREHLSIKEFKKVNRILEQKINIRNDRLDKVMDDFNEKMKTTKNTIIDKDYVKVRKDTFESMNNVIKETEKIIEMQPKINSALQEINNYTDIYNSLQKDNQKYQKEIESLKYKNEKLEKENINLKRKISIIMDNIKIFFGKALQKGTEIIKNLVVDEVKDYFFHERFDDKDVYDISRGTSKEDELFEYANIPYYYKEYDENRYNQEEKDKDDFDLSL